jgi:hypothetical protein
MAVAYGEAAAGSGAPRAGVAAGRTWGEATTGQSLAQARCLGELMLVMMRGHDGWLMWARL